MLFIVQKSNQQMSFQLFNKKGCAMCDCNKQYLITDSKDVLEQYHRPGCINAESTSKPIQYELKFTELPLNEHPFNFEGGFA